MCSATPSTLVGRGNESVELYKRLLRNLLAAGAVGSLSKLSPPRPSGNGVPRDRLVKKAKGEKPKENQLLAGMGIGSLLSDQLERNVATVRRSVEQDVSAGLPN